MHEVSMFFFEKQHQKTFAPAAPGVGHANGLKLQKSFAELCFSKATAFFLESFSC
jgi:hypothetical protein